MRRILLIISIIFIGTMVACSDKNTPNEQEDKNDIENEVSEDTINQDEVNENNPGEDNATDNEPVENEAVTPDEHADFEESEILYEHVDMDNMHVEVEVDNQNKRIILVKNDNNEATYKTIYIKHDNHLKIVDLKDDDLVYNDSIK